MTATKKPRKWCRDPQPLYAVRIRTRRGGLKVRMIKVRMDGPKSRRWMNYARWWWIQNKGPIPHGKRVAHVDGNSLNDDPSNYALCTPGDVAYLCHERDPRMSARNHEKMRRATAAFNRTRAHVRRQTEWIPTKWYAVNVSWRLVLNVPRRMRWQVYRDVGLSVDSRNWRFVRSMARAVMPEIRAMRGCELAADPSCREFHRTDQASLLFTRKEVG
jgi:hypothetical protein